MALGPLGPQVCWARAPPSRLPGPPADPRTPDHRRLLSIPVGPDLQCGLFIAAPSSGALSPRARANRPISGHGIEHWTGSAAGLPRSRQPALSAMVLILQSRRVLSAAQFGRARAELGGHRWGGYERSSPGGRMRTLNVQSAPRLAIAAPSPGVKRRATLAAGTGARMRRLTRSRRAQLDGDVVVLAQSQWNVGQRGGGGRPCSRPPVRHTASSHGSAPCRSLAAPARGQRAASLEPCPAAPQPPGDSAIRRFGVPTAARRSTSPVTSVPVASARHRPRRAQQTRCAKGTAACPSWLDGPRGRQHAHLARAREPPASTRASAGWARELPAGEHRHQGVRTTGCVAGVR
jgi:hypothetical protein